RIEVKTALKGITAVRLEALVSTAETNQGPGRSTNGNFVLTGFELELKPEKAKTNETIKFLEASADFSQDKYPVKEAIDGDAKTGWAIGGGKNSQQKSRQAWFFPKEPFNTNDRATLIFRLKHESKLPQHN